MLFRGINLPAIDQLASFLVIKGVVKPLIRPLDMQIGIVGDDVQFFGIIQSLCFLLRHRAVFQFGLNLQTLFIGSKENDLRRQHFGILSREIFLDVGGFIGSHLVEIADQPVFRLPGGHFGRLLSLCWCGNCFCRCRFRYGSVLLLLRRGYVDASFLANLPIMLLNPGNQLRRSLVYGFQTGTEFLQLLALGPGSDITEAVVGGFNAEILADGIGNALGLHFLGVSVLFSRHKDGFAIVCQLRHFLIIVEPGMGYFVNGCADGLHLAHAFP